MARAPTVRSLYAGLFTLWTHTDAQVHSSEQQSPSLSENKSQLSGAASAGSSPTAAAVSLKPKSPTDAAPRLVPAATTTTPADASQQQSLRIWYLPDGDPQFASLARFFPGASASGDELSLTRMRTPASGEQFASWSEIFVVHCIGF